MSRPPLSESPPRPRARRRAPALGLASALILGLAACAGGPGPAPQGPPVTLEARHSHAVSLWTGIAVQTVLAPGGSATPAETRPSFAHDLATVHVAIFDAVVAVRGRYQPFALPSRAPAGGASVDAAVAAAAHGVLKALFPSRAEAYQADYEQQLAALPEGPAKAQGLALGAEAAAAVLRLRADDGRGVALAPYVSGQAPGQFRAANPNPVFRHLPAIRPFALDSVAQFRPGPPPALDSAAYAQALDETRALGGATSSLRTPQQLEVARFHTEPPPAFVSRNFGRLAASTADVADAARLMALVWVSFADTLSACFEAKYHHAAWRPATAIAVTDPAWTPALPTPNHPEYPAAHSCTSGSLGESLRQHFGTPQVRFSMDSRVTGSTRQYDGTEAFNDENRWARIHGGMHFRFATQAGAELGQRVARHVASRHFQRRD